jgi:hypothetical protein
MRAAAFERHGGPECSGLRKGIHGDAEHRCAGADADPLGGGGGQGDGVPRRDDIAAGLHQAYGIPTERAAAIAVTGRPLDAAQRLAGYHAAGARHLVMGFSGGHWREQCELLAEAARHVNERPTS